MMKNKSFVADTVMADLAAGSIKQVYQAISVRAGTATNVAPARIYKQLIEQESLSPSGIGGGVALPHLRLEGLDKPYILVASLRHYVNFQSTDNQPVDLVCLLISPEGVVASHLQRLSRLTRLFRDEDLRTQLRHAKNKDTMQALLMEGRTRQQQAA